MRRSEKRIKSNLLRHNRHPHGRDKPQLRQPCWARSPRKTNLFWTKPRIVHHPAIPESSSRPDAECIESSIGRTSQHQPNGVRAIVPEEAVSPGAKSRVVERSDGLHVERELHSRVRLTVRLQALRPSVRSDAGRKRIERSQTPRRTTRARK